MLKHLISEKEELNKKKHIISKLHELQFEICISCPSFSREIWGEEKTHNFVFIPLSVDTPCEHKEFKEKSEKTPEVQTIANRILTQSHPKTIIEYFVLFLL